MLNGNILCHSENIALKSHNVTTFLCRLRSIATHRDHFVRRPSVCLSVRLSHFVCHTFQSYVSQATHAFLGMLPLFLYKRHDVATSPSCKNSFGPPPPPLFDKFSGSAPVIYFKKSLDLRSGYLLLFPNT